MQHINYCSHAEQLTFNCHKEGRGVYHGTVVYFVIFRCCFFPWYKGSLRDNSFNRNFLYMRLSYKATIAESPVGIPGNKNRTNLSSEEAEKTCYCVKSLPMLTHPRVHTFLFFVYKLFSSWIWLKYCLLVLKQSINQSSNSHTLLYPALFMCQHCLLT